MDGKSHVLFAESLLRCVRARKPKTYAESWACAPDADFGLLHRWRLHRFSVLPKIYETTLKSLPTAAPADDKNAICVCIASHFLLDMFNAPLYCFGLPFVTKRLPKEAPKELLRDLSKITFSPPPQFHDDEQRLFGEYFKRNHLTAAELTHAIIVVLAEHTCPATPNLERRAFRHVLDFDGTLRPSVNAAELLRRFVRDYGELLRAWCLKI